MKFPWIFSPAGTTKDNWAFGVWGKHPGFADFVDVQPVNIKPPLFLRYFQKGVFKGLDGEKGWFCSFKRGRAEAAFFKKSFDSIKRPCPLVVYAMALVDADVELWSLFHNLPVLFKRLEAVSETRYNTLQELKKKLQIKTILEIKMPELSQNMLTEYILQIKKMFFIQKDRWIADKSMTLMPGGQTFQEDTVCFLRAAQMYWGVAPQAVMLWFCQDKIYLKIFFREPEEYDFAESPAKSPFVQAMLNVEC